MAVIKQTKQFSKDLAILIKKHKSRGISDTEIVGDLRLLSTMIEANACGGTINHVIVMDVKQIDNDDKDEWWKSSRN